MCKKKIEQNYLSLRLRNFFFLKGCVGEEEWEQLCVT